MGGAVAGEAPTPEQRAAIADLHEPDPSLPKGGRWCWMEGVGAHGSAVRDMAALSVVGCLWIVLAKTSSCEQLCSCLPLPPPQAANNLLPQAAPAAPVQTWGRRALPSCLRATPPPPRAASQASQEGGRRGCAGTQGVAPQLAVLNALLAGNHIHMQAPAPAPAPSHWAAARQGRAGRAPTSTPRSEGWLAPRTACQPRWHAR